MSAATALARIPMHGPTLLGCWDSWALALRANDRAASTLVTYEQTLRDFEAWLGANDLPTAVMAITKQDVQAFMLHLKVERRLADTTRHTWHAVLSAFFNWALEEGEIVASPMAGVRPPKVLPKAVPVVKDGDLTALLRACSGTDFNDRRDLAILRLMIDTGMRRSEVGLLDVQDVDMHSLLVTIRHAKGGRVRRAQLGVKAGQALDRYLRVRRSHPHASSPRLWLSRQGGMGGDGIAYVLRVRAEQAGIGSIHPHQLRHTYASKALASGMQEGDVMRQAGWSSRSMLSRYGADAADERSREAHRRIGTPGDAL